MGNGMKQSEIKRTGLLEIRYSGTGHSGVMTVDLDRFFAGRKITKVKKLLRLIRSSDSPEAEEQVREYVKGKSGKGDLKQEEFNRKIWDRLEGGRL